MVTALMKLRRGFDRTDPWVSDIAAEVLAVLIDDPSTRRLDRAPRWLMSAREELRGDFINGVRVTRIAQSVGVNRVTLSRGFRLYFGCTPSDYVRRLRIEKAVALIARGENAATVAVAVGCADQSHFARLLRDDVGITPRQIRTLNFR
jgi:AraC family transcriptional regulator